MKRFGLLSIGFLLLVSSIHTAESKNILELYNAIAFSKIARRGEGHTGRYTIEQYENTFSALPQGSEGSTTDVIVDYKNGYLKVEEDVLGNASFGTYCHEAAKFSGSRNRTFIALSIYLSGPILVENRILVFEYKNGTCVDCTKEVLPRITIADFVPSNFSATLIKELEDMNNDISWFPPRHGTNLTVKLKKSYLADKFEFEDPPVMRKKVQQLAAAINREEIQLKWNRDKCVFER